MTTETATANKFLQRFREKNRESWKRFISCYVPFVYDLCRRNGCSGEMARQLTEETIRDVCHEVKTLRSDSSNRSMQNWLETIVIHRLGESGIMQITRDQTPMLEGNGPTLTMAMPQIQKSTPRQSLGIMTRCALRSIESEFEPREMEAFRRAVIDGESISSVATDMQESTAWVCTVRYRVLTRLRQELEDR
ncbi:MAG: RNA polymerase sigma factor [Planctomycetaceae bacterium]